MCGKSLSYECVGISSCEHYLEKTGGEGVKTPDSPMDRAGILDAAKHIVCGDRNQQYGEPEDNFDVIAKLWSVYLSAQCPPSHEIVFESEDIAVMMALFKIGRFATAIDPKADTFIDIAGYAACAGEIALRK